MIHKWAVQIAQVLVLVVVLVNAISHVLVTNGKWALIIAHRLSTIRNANRIVSIADGYISECGTHEELLETGGIYAQLYKTQNALALEALK